MNITFITGHDAKSRRKTGFHFWAEILTQRGEQVNWVTVGFSQLTQFKDESKIPPGPYNRWAGENPRRFVWCPLFHPVNLGPLNNFLEPVFNLYPRMMPSALLNGIQDSDMMIVETGAGLLLVPALAERCPKAKIIYFASDRLETLNAHPAIVAAEKNALSHIALVRVISESSLADFAGHPNVRYIPQGIDKDVFDRAQNPYRTENNIVCAGDMLFDAASVEIMARAFPDWHFHLFGRYAKLKAPLPNVTEYGEQGFDFIVPYIKFADIGLAPYRARQGGDYFVQSSLKIAQYTYCRLPVLAPDFLKSIPAHILPYQPGNAESMKTALQAAAAYDRGKIDSTAIPASNKVIDKILEQARQ